MAEQIAFQTIPLIAEELRVEKRSRVTGRVRVSTTSELVDEVAKASLLDEKVEVTRVPIGHEVTVRPVVRTENDVVIIPVVEEILVVEKRLVLKEELHVRRVITQENVEVPVTLRKQRAVIERVGATQNSRDNEEADT